jgi:hypothetical protein
MESLGNRQKIARILSSHIGHTAYLPLTPKQFVVVKARHMVKITAVRLKVEENQLVGIFGKIGVLVDGLKGA